LPLTANGKLDRQALPTPDLSAAAVEGYVAPQTPVEEVVAGIWQELLHVERVGVTDNFFELGGHSLLATQVISRLRSVLAVDVPLRSLFEQPTVAGLAQFVEAALRGGESVQMPPLQRVGRDELLPLSINWNPRALPTICLPACS
jgi:acyl carrier protein